MSARIGALGGGAAAVAGVARGTTAVRAGAGWRSLDLGVMQAFVEADAPRVNCALHGPTVIAVPWARHSAGHTRMFDDMVAWLAVHTSKTAVGQLMRIAWRTVVAIVARVSADAEAADDRLAGLRRIGIDELSYKKGHRYITCVVDHDSGHLVWAAPGRDKATLNTFFDALGAQRCAQITHVSADLAVPTDNSFAEVNINIVPKPRVGHIPLNGSTSRDSLINEGTELRLGKAVAEGVFGLPI